MVNLLNEIKEFPKTKKARKMASAPAKEEPVQPPRYLMNDNTELINNLVTRLERLEEDNKALKEENNSLKVKLLKAELERERPEREETPMDSFRTDSSAQMLDDDHVGLLGSIEGEIRRLKQARKKARDLAHVKEKKEKEREREQEREKGKEKEQEKSKGKKRNEGETWEEDELEG